MQVPLICLLSSSSRPACTRRLQCSILRLILYTVKGKPFIPLGQKLIVRSGRARHSAKLWLEGSIHIGCMLSALFKAACPVLCSGNGQYLKGRCMCHSGWKGSECDVPTNQCIDITCSSHGTCIVGTCICNPGYKGENCEEGDGSDKSRSCGSVNVWKSCMMWLVLTFKCSEFTNSARLSIWLI